MNLNANVLSLFVLCADLATVVGYLVVSRPFLNMAHPRHLHSTHAELLEVSYLTHGLKYINELKN